MLTAQPRFPVVAGGKASARKTPASTSRSASSVAAEVENAVSIGAVRELPRVLPQELFFDVPAAVNFVLMSKGTVKLSSHDIVSRTAYCLRLDNAPAPVAFRRSVVQAQAVGSDG